jgi:hypothetical protein
MVHWVHCQLSNVNSLGRGEQCIFEGKAGVTTSESRSAIYLHEGGGIWYVKKYKIMNYE